MLWVPHMIHMIHGVPITYDSWRNQKNIIWIHVLPLIWSYEL